MMSEGTLPLVWRADFDLNFTSIDQGWLQYTGGLLEAELERGWLQHLHEDDRAACIQTLDSAAAAQTSFSVAVRVKNAGGFYRWFQMNGIFLPTADLQTQGFVGSWVDIDDMRAASQQRNELQALVGALREGTFDAVAIHDQGIALEINEAFTALFGYERDEVIGKNCVALVIPSQERERIIQYYATPRATPYEILMQRKDGSTFLAELRAKSIEYGGRRVRCVVAREISRMRDTTNLLRFQTELLDQGFDALFVWKGGEGIVQWYGGAARLFGYTSTEAIGGDARQLLRIVTPATPEEIEALLRRTGSWQGEVVLQTKHGEVVIGESRMRRLLSDDGGLLVLETVRDITASKGLQHQAQLLQRLSTAFSQAVTPEAIAAVLVDTALDMVGVHTASVHVLADNTLQLEPIYLRSAADPLSPTPLTAADAVTLAAEAVRQGKPIWIDRRSANPDYVAGADETPMFPSTSPVAALPLIGQGNVIGVVLVQFRQEQEIKEESRTFLITATHLCAQAMERALLFVKEQRSRQTAEALADRLERLQTVTTALLDTLTISEVAKIFVDQAAAVLKGDHGALSLQLDEQTFALVYALGSRLPPREQEKWVRYPNDPALPVPDVVRRGEALWFSNVGQLTERYPAMQSMAHLLPGAIAVLPLAASDRMLGGLIFGFVDRTGFDPDERRFILTLVNHCAQALDRARLYEAEQQARLEAEAARQRTMQLQTLTAALSESLTPAQVADVILDKSFELFKVQAGSIAIITDDGTFLEVLAWRGYEQALIERWKRFPLDAPTMLGASLEVQEGIWIPDRESLNIAYPELTRSAASHHQAWMALPLIVDRLKIGVLGFSFTAPQTFEPAEREFMRTVARYCAQAVQRARLYEAEANARAKAEEADRTKTRFLAMVSHELRTPLTSILGFSSVLVADEALAAIPLHQRFLSAIYTEAQRLASLVEQLLDIARLQAGIFNLTLEATAVSELIAELEPRLRVLTVQHSFSITLAPDLPLVQADRSRVVQVLSNLIENAANYSPTGTSIRLSIEGEGGFVRFSVLDQGPGIPQAIRPSAFEAFRQLQMRTNATQKGLGLGLAICKGIVEAHGGQIEIRDNEPTGAAVTFLLPALMSQQVEGM